MGVGYDKLWRIQIDLFFDQKYTDVILYPLKLLKNLDKPKEKTK